MRRTLPFAATVVALCLATWLYAGYRYGLWPQPGFLNYVLHYDGALVNDWSTGLPPYHWFVSKGLGLLPESAVEPAVLVLWIAELAALWAGFVGVCRALGAPLPVALASGLIAIPTGLSALGSSGTLHSYFYPTDLSFAIAVCALALGLHRRWLAAGVASGLAILAHPGVGILSAAVILPALALHRGIDRGRVVRLVVPAVLIGAPSVLQAMSAQVGGSSLSARDRFDLVAIVRLPHHMLYRAFPMVEYAQTVTWLVAAAAGVALLVFAARRIEARAVAIAAGLVVLAAVVGGLASQHGSPLALVQAQTARLTPFLVMLGCAAAGAALASRIGLAAALALAVVFVAGGWFGDHVLESVAGARADWVDASVAEGVLVLFLLGLAAIAPLGARRILERAGPAAAAAAIALAAVSLLVDRAERAPVTPAEITALEDVGHRLEQISAPGTVALTPPDQDLARFFSHRPIVVEYGDFRFGKGDTEWIRRMRDVTENPAVLDPAQGTDAVARSALIAESYDRVIASSRKPICKYRTPLVIARAAVPPPSWLERLYANGVWQILKVRPETCG